MKPSIVLLAAATALSASAYEEIKTGDSITRIVKAGETMEMGGTGYDPFNINKNIIDLQAGATLCISNTWDKNGNPVDAWRVWANLVCTNGTAYVTRKAGETGTTMAFRHSLIVLGDGKLRIKEFPQANFGMDIGNLRHFWGESILDAADVAFCEADGVTYRTGTFALDGPCAIRTPPAKTAENLLTLSLGSSRRYLLLNGNIWSTDDTFAPNAHGSSCTFLLAEPNALKTGATVTVPKNYQFGVLPVVPSETYAYTLRLATLTDPAFTNDVNIVLADATSTLLLTNGNNAVLQGDISGSGSVVSVMQRTGTATITSSLVGNNTYTGGTYVNGAYLTLLFGASVPPGSVYLQGSYSSVGTVPPAEGGPASVTLPSVIGSYYSAKILAAANQTVTVQSAAGKVWGSPLDDSAVVDFNPAIGGAIVRAFDAPNVFFNGSAAKDTNVLLARNSENTETLIRLTYADGSYNYSDLTPPAQTPWILAGDGVSVSDLPDDKTLRAISNATVSASFASARTTASFLTEPDATLAVHYDINDWTNRAALWVDPNVSQLYKVGELALQEWIDKLGTPTHAQYVSKTDLPFIEGLADVRPDQTYLRLQNARLYNDVNKKTGAAYASGISSVYAVLDDNGPGGTKCIDCKYDTNNRRMPIGVGPTTAGDSSYLKTKLIVMLFNPTSSKAMIGTRGAKFGRTNTDAGTITTNAVDATIWINGTQKDPTTDTFADGWQVVTIAINNTNLSYDLNGFGWLCDYSKSGGGRYGEMLVFTNDVTTLMRHQVEAYLANKWSVTAYQADAGQTEPAMDVTLSGNGAATLSEGKMTVSGSFSGTATLAGTTLTIPAALPWSETDVAATSPLLWLDPTDEAAFVLDTVDGVKNGVRGYMPRGITASTITDKTLFAMSYGGRHPFRRIWRRGLGVERAWIDYEHSSNHTAGKSDGNVIRFKLWNASVPITDKTYYETGDSDTNVQARTFFVATDSFRGGGDVLREGVSSYTASFGSRGNYPAIGTYLWKDGKTAVKNGSTRLNGATLSGTSFGYTGEPEVLSLVATTKVPFGAMGRFQNTESVTNALGVYVKTLEHAEMIGETIVYEDAVTDEVRGNIELYLMNKWTGRLPHGYTDWRGATLDGSGSVTVASAAVCPHIADTFEGSLKIEGSTQSFNITVTPETGSAEAVVTGGLLLPNAALTLPAACSLTADFTAFPSRATEKRYTLIEGAAGSKLNDVNWSTTLGSVATRAGAQIVTSDTKVELVVRPVGMLMFFR